MPLQLSADEIKEALEKGSSDLRFILEKNGVDNFLQACLFHSGITTVPLFAAIAKDVTDLKQLVKDEFGVDSTAGLVDRVRVANLQISWTTSEGRTSEQAKIEGELSAKHIVKPMSSSEFIGMRQSWEKKYWVLDDDVVPARTYLEKRAEDLEQEDFKAESLQSVLTREQDDPDVLVPVWSTTGALQMKKGSQLVDEPKNPEQLRKRLKVLSLGLMFLGLRHTNRGYLQGITPQTFEDYVTYLLSEHCFYMQGKTAEGFVINGPSWQQLLVYELQVRKKAWSLVQNTGCTFEAALRAAWKDPVVKERFLTTPVALSASSAPKQRNTEGDNAGGGGKGTGRRTKVKKNQGKGKGGKGKGGGKGGKSASEKLGCAARTPDGSPICYGYNDFAVRCKSRDCRFQHVCGICFAKHPLYACKPGNKAETQGTGLQSE